MINQTPRVFLQPVSHGKRAGNIDFSKNRADPNRFNIFPPNSIVHLHSALPRIRHLIILIVRRRLNRGTISVFIYSYQIIVS